MLGAMPPRPDVKAKLVSLVESIRSADPGALVRKNPASFMDEIQLELTGLHAAVAGGYFNVAAA
jgi:hypothetical protein